MGRKLGKSDTKSRKSGKKWEEKGKIVKKMGSLPLRTGRAGYGPVPVPNYASS